MKLSLCKEIEVGERPLAIQTDYGRIAVVRLNGQIHAFEDICTHDDGPLAEGNIENESISCPRHGAVFCLKDGRALQMPATEGIETFTVTLNNGMVEVEID